MEENAYFNQVCVLERKIVQTNVVHIGVHHGFNFFILHTFGDLFEHFKPQDLLTLTTSTSLFSTFSSLSSMNSFVLASFFSFFFFLGKFTFVIVRKGVFTEHANCCLSFTLWKCLYHFRTKNQYCIYRTSVYGANFGD